MKLNIKCDCCDGKGSIKLEKLNMRPKFSRMFLAVINLHDNTILFNDELFYSKRAFIKYLEGMIDNGGWLDWYYNLDIDNSDLFVNNVFANILKRYHIDFK